MRFLYPSFLFALFTVIIPIVIHLFSFRKFQTVYFSNVNYLKNIRKESKKKSRIKHLLILLARILAIVSLVFAFSQPYIPLQKHTPRQAGAVVAVYIDNSFSMNALSTQGQLIEVARNKAIEIAGAHSPGTRFMLITNDMLPQHQHIFNKEQFIQQVSEIKSSPKSIPLSMIQEKLISQVSREEPHTGFTTFYLSDFQKNSTDLMNFSSDTTLISYFIPLSGNASDNLYIDSCWIELPAHKLGQEENMMVRIVNNSGNSFRNLPLKLTLNDTIKALANFNIDPGGEQVVELKYMNMSGGLQGGYAEISDYPITYDNTFYLSYRVQSHLKALAIFDQGFQKGHGLHYLRALFQGDDYVSLEEMGSGNLQFSKLDIYNTIFILNTLHISSGLASELKKAAENGTTLVFFPEPEGNINDYNNLLASLNANLITRFDTTRRQLAGLNRNHPVYEQVFSEYPENANFPSVNGSFLFTNNTRIPETTLLWLRNRAKATSIQTVGNGNLVVFSFPLSRQNDEFARHILFVPTLYSLVINSLPQQKISYTIGRETFAAISRNEVPDLSLFSVKNSHTGEELKPELSVSGGNMVRIGFSEFFDRAGLYGIYSLNQPISLIAMNYDRRESKSGYLTADELETETGRYHLQLASVLRNQENSFGEIFDEIIYGKKLWIYFIILSLGMILAEALLIRLWK
jgi:hypothetical protein